MFVVTSTTPKSAIPITASKPALLLKHFPNWVCPLCGVGKDDFSPEA